MTYTPCTILVIYGRRRRYLFYNMNISHFVGIVHFAIHLHIFYSMKEINGLHVGPFAMNKQHSLTVQSYVVRIRVANHKPYHH